MSGGGHGHGGGLPLLNGIYEWFENSHDKGGYTIPGTFIIVAGVVAVFVFNLVAPLQSIRNWELAFAAAPVWLTVALCRFSLLRWLQMKRSFYNYNNKMVLLELRMPREVLKSPQAMETVFSSLNLNPGEGTWWKKYWWGRTRPWWSIEIVSLEGEIHFYITTRGSFRRSVESFFYAQYPEIEIIEAKDYARLRDPSHAPYAMFACEYKEGAAAPFPIKTYVEYGLDKPALKVEEQVDPFAQILELFGSLGPGEQLWTQIMIRVAKSEKYRGQRGKKYTWRDEAKEIVEELRQEIINPISGFPNPTEVQKEKMYAVERNVGKLGYDVGIRSIYSAPVDKYKSMNPFVANMFKPVNTTNYNSIIPAPLWSEKFNDYPWEDFGGRRQRHENHEVVEMYRYRAFYHPPYRGVWMTMSTEELATLFHFPSSIVKTPSLPRISSSTASAPSNLPT